MRAVNEVKKMFTLADVLPSSLENSRQEISQQNALLKVQQQQLYYRHQSQRNNNYDGKTLHTDEDIEPVEDI